MVLQNKEIMRPPLLAAQIVSRPYTFDEEREERHLTEGRGKVTRVEFFSNIPKIVRRVALHIETIDRHFPNEEAIFSRRVAFDRYTSITSAKKMTDNSIWNSIFQSMKRDIIHACGLAQPCQLVLELGHGGLEVGQAFALLFNHRSRCPGDE